MRISLLLLLLLAVSPALTSDFHLFLAFSCEPACILIVNHQEKEEFYMLNGRHGRISRHFDEPVPEVKVKLDYFHNATDFETTTIEMEWVSHENKTFYFEQHGIFIIGHYFCPEGRCHVDSTRTDYRKQVNRWSYGLIFSGVFFFMLLSGAGEALYNYLKRGLQGNEKEAPLSYDKLVMTSKREEKEGEGLGSSRQSE